MFGRHVGLLKYKVTVNEIPLTTKSKPKNMFNSPTKCNKYKEINAQNIVQPCEIIEEVL